MKEQLDLTTPLGHFHVTGKHMVTACFISLLAGASLLYYFQVRYKVLLP